MKTWTVQISKVYFEKEFSSQAEPFTDVLHSWNVRAEDRVQAAHKVWKLHGGSLLKKMRQDIKSVSLYSGCPAKRSKTTGDVLCRDLGSVPGRLTPIKVFSIHST